jgi:hypothetical protein
MPLAPLDLAIEQDTDWTNTYVVATPDTSTIPNPANMTYYNFAGWTFTFQVNEEDNVNSVGLLTLTVGSGITITSGQIQGGPAPTANNAIQVTITSAQSAAMPVGVWDYDLIGLSLSGLRTCILKGNFEVRNTNARP